MSFARRRGPGVAQLPLPSRSVSRPSDLLRLPPLLPQAALIRIGLAEMMHFCKKFYEGVQDKTFFESCGVADLYVGLVDRRHSGRLPVCLCVCLFVRVFLCLFVRVPLLPLTTCSCVCVCLCVLLPLAAASQRVTAAVTASVQRRL